MKIIRFILCVSLLLPTVLKGQEIEQSVIAPAGGHHETTSSSISWNLGELAVETYTGTSFMLSQGFQQGDLTIIGIHDELIPDVVIKAYPNPFLNKLNVEFGQDKLQFKIVDINGRTIKNGILYSGFGILDFQGISKGTYFLVTNQKQTYKIIKK